MQKITLTAAAVALLGLAAVGAQATTLTFSDDADITVTGPAKASYTVNTEGAMSSGNTGQYTDFAVVDFKSSLSSITGASNLVFSAVDQGAGYEAPGLLDFWLASNTSVGIDNPATTIGTTPIGGPASPLTYQATAAANPVGVGTQLGVEYLLGQVAFVPSGTKGTVLSYNLSLSSAAAQALFAQEVNAGSVRLLMTTDTAGSQAMATAFYGINSTSTAAGPITLSFTPNAGPAVPETSPLALLGLGLLPVGLIARRRRAVK